MESMVNSSEVMQYKRRTTAAKVLASVHERSEHFVRKFSEAEVLLHLMDCQQHHHDDSVSTMAISIFVHGCYTEIRFGKSQAILS
jgi:hypothetical protein